MTRRFVLLALLAISLINSPSLLAQAARMAVCPDANPTQRPDYIDLSNQSKWDIEKVVDWMHMPAPNVLTPGEGLVLVVSHRGNWEYCPENTLESFQSAWDLGAESIEMDIRLSKPGMDNGVDYPKGEAFLSHDFDLRGEAPNPQRLGQNYITSLTPAELRARDMADRHGLILRDSSGHHLHLGSVTDLFTSILLRAKSLGLVEPAGNGWTRVRGGALLVLDVKNLTPPEKRQPATTQFETFMEALKELNDFQQTNKVFMDRAVAYKVGFTHFVTDFRKAPAPYGTPAELIQAVQSKDVDYIPGTSLPLLIFIVFPEDVCVKTGPNPDNCIVTPPQNYTALNDYGKNYSSLIANDWQYRNENDALATYLTYDAFPEWSGWKPWGSAMFLASNNFAEGVRNSAANCSNFSHPYKYPPFPNPDYPPVNFSGCVSDPIQRWSSSSLDYLVPSFGPPKHATTITTDQFQNAMDYLTAIGLNNQDRLKYSPPGQPEASAAATQRNNEGRKKATDAR